MTDVDIVVHGHHVDVSSRFREHANDKLARVDRFGVQISRIDLELSKETNPRLADKAFTVELTLRGKGPVIRAEAASSDKYSALDLASTRLEERLRRVHDKARVHKGDLRQAKRIDLSAEAELIANGAVPEQPERDFGVVDDELYSNGPLIVRDKTHDTVPMTIEEAVTEMEMVGHDFFLFHDVDSDAPAVVYHRRGFDYGLIRISTAKATISANEG